MKYLFTVISLFLMLITASHAAIVPDNNLYIPVDSKAIYKVTETNFNIILDRLETLYKPVIEKKEAELKIIRKWDDGTVNAYAQQDKKIWKVTMFGGLARHKTITNDAFALVGCHELGHHLGGAPKYSSRWSKWASNEGQADFWSTSKCFRIYVSKDDNIALMKKTIVPKIVTKACKDQFKGKEEVAICQRGALAGMSLGNLFRALRNQDKKLKFDTPDKAIVSKTKDGHPAPQCRLDTYYSGALCDRNEFDDISDEDANISLCNRQDGDTIGIRPLCWYKPNE